jgi:ectoine hydroxylase-related dioxygenase (phytanoyl-CoA dioxygenase family)
MSIPRITEKHQETLLRHGYVVVPQFLTADELRAAQSDMMRYFPSAEELAARPQRYGWIHDDPENLQVEFPFAADALNHHSTHPEIIAFARRLLGTREVLLSQAAIWAKYAGTGTFEQTMHLDYQGNTLVVPRDDGAFRQINMILYYSDVTEGLGPTFLVSLEKTGKLGLWPTFRPRKEYPRLYRDERSVLAEAGDLLVFSMRTFHRAGELTADHGARFSHHLVYRAAEHPFNGYHQYSQFGEKPEMQRFIQKACPSQREVLGFPRPGHSYWNKETLAGVKARYPGIDMGPYLTKTDSRRV